MTGAVNSIYGSTMCESYPRVCQIISTQPSPSRRLPDGGGAVKVQIYSPYVIVNKTGLPFSVKSVRSNRAGPPQDVAGETPSGRILVDFLGAQILLIFLLIDTTPFRMSLDHLYFVTLI
jgi:SHR-binding domain of vacuolar-sorting associated protein 13